MSLYLLSYDILDKNHDYQSLWDWLDGASAVRILYSEWAVPWNNDSSALQLIKTAIQHVKDGDQLFACELFDNVPTCAWRGLKITNDEFRALLKRYARTST